MTNKEKKEQFIIMRASGHSYNTIAKELGISKSTCTAWNNELQYKIQEYEDERTQELKAKYKLTKAGHIERLGETLERIDQAIAQADLSEVPADKLLKLKLEYEEKLHAESEPEHRQESLPAYTAEEIVTETKRIYERLKAGEISPQTAKVQLYILEGINRTRTIAENDELLNINISYGLSESDRNFVESLGITPEPDSKKTVADYLNDTAKSVWSDQES